MDPKLKQNIRRQRARYVAMDWIATCIAFLLFDILRAYLLSGHSLRYEVLINYLGQPKLLLEQLLIPLVIMGVNWLSGYYNHPFRKSRLHELTLTLESSFFNAAWISLMLLINDHFELRRTDYLVIFLLFVLLFSTTYCGRLLLTTLALKRMRRRGYTRHILLIGSPRKREKFESTLSKSKNTNYNIVGFIDIDGDRVKDSETIARAVEKAEEICRRNKVDEVIILQHKNSDKLTLQTLSRLFPREIPIKILPDTLSYITQSIHTASILDEPLIDLTRPRLSDCEKNLKRLFDVSISALTLLILSPLILALGIAVKADSPGPVFYSQVRIGKRRKPFRIYKFRTMREDAEAFGPALSSASDSRVTRVGRILRKYRLDELPQFWNVIRGDMSIVGPRPEREYYIRQILRDAPYYALTFQVRPGITSWGMVKFGYASSLKQMLERTKFDLIYITNMSLSLDIKIMIYTIRTILNGAGV